jgi:hypothetical protein
MFDSDSVDCPAKAQRRKVRTTILMFFTLAPLRDGGKIFLP